MITIERISHFAAAIVTRGTDTRVCCIGLLSTASSCGDVKVFAFVAPSSYDGCLPVMCESQNFESIFRSPAILHPRFRPRPLLHVSPSRRLRHVTKRTVPCCACQQHPSPVSAFFRKPATYHHVQKKYAGAIKSQHVIFLMDNL